MKLSTTYFASSTVKYGNFFFDQYCINI